MSLIKFSLVFVALLATVYAGSSSWGKRNSTDILLMNEVVIRTAVYNSYSTVDVQFPRSGTTNTRTISGIFVHDRFTNSSGAFATLRSGGPGYRFASINLKSQFSRGINSTVEIWGR